MGKRNRAKQRLRAPSSDYTDAEGNVLTLRGSLSPAARREYAETLAGGRRARGEHAGGRLAARRRAAVRAPRRALEIAGAPIERQRELLARFRAAGPDERAWVRDALREHCAEHFPDVQAP